MRILVVGAGATGGYYGARLAQAGRDVTFLVRPDRAAFLTSNGLSVLSPHGDVSLQPKLVTASQLQAQYDVILLTVKAYGLTAALEDVAPAVGVHTMIVPTLNGMRHVGVIGQRFGERTFVGGVCRIAATIDSEGRIVQLNKVHDLIYGEMDGTRSERMVVLDDLMQNAGFVARLSSNVHQEMWDKWVLLAALAGSTCLMRATVGEVASVSVGLEFVEGLLNEIVDIATAAGFPPEAAYVDDTRKVLTQQGSPMTSSMYRDMMATRSVEADEILGDLLMHAKNNNLKAPFLTAAFANLAVYQTRLVSKNV